MSDWEMFMCVGKVSSQGNVLWKTVCWENVSQGTVIWRTASQGIAQESFI